MRKDGKEFKLTKEPAVELHRKMWRYLVETEDKYNCPSLDRDYVKKQWLYLNGFDLVKNDCFLCEYVKQHCGGKCSECPIDWGVDKNGGSRSCKMVPKFTPPESLLRLSSLPIELELEYKIAMEEYFKTHLNELNIEYSPIKAIAEAPLKREG